MTETQAFVINQGSVVHEDLEGEVILIHLETGAYYSFNGVAREIWALIGDGTSNRKIADTLARLYQEDHTQIESAVFKFLGQLHAESLIIPGQAHVSESPESPDSGTPEKARLPFLPPQFEKYTDMQEFLMVDPIHEVTDDGWPHKLPG